MIAHCKIEDGVAELNGNRIEYASHSGANWKKNLYKHLKLNYPKFFKMDDLSKLSLLCMELLKTSTNFDEGELSMVFANKSASTFTDNKYVSSLDKGMPSPSLFVYTLPNVSVGELTIKHSFHGSSSFYITETLSDLPIQELLQIEFNKGYKVVLIGWVEKSEEEDFGLFFMFDNHSTKEDLALIKSFNK
jgi:hypothetical protein